MKKIVIDGIIGLDTYGSKVRNLLEEANGEELIIEIASPGGLVFSGLEIYNLIKNYSEEQNHVTTKIVGLAASMASYIALAGNKVIAEDASVYMIHNVLSCVCGDYRQMKKEANIIEGLTDLLAKAYSKKSGKSKKEIRQMMDDETFLFGNQMVKEGFVDEIITTNKNKQQDLLVAEAQDRIKNCIQKIQESEKSRNELQKVASLYPDIMNYSNEIEVEDYEMFEPENPYPNEHAARVKDPDDFKKDSMRSKKLSKPGLRIIIGKLKNDGDSMVTQAYRFNKANWTVAEAKKWLKDNKIKYISFEAASGSKDENLITEDKKIMDKKELQEKYPDLYNEVFQDGVNSVNEKIKNINALMEFKDIAPKIVLDAISKNEKYDVEFKAKVEKEQLVNNMKKDRTNDNPEDIKTPTNTGNDKEDTEKAIAEFNQMYNTGGKK